MQEIKDIPIAQITHGNLPMNKKALLFAMQMLVEKHLFPPVKVELAPRGRYKLRGGRHRLAAHKLLERTHIRAKVSPRMDFDEVLNA